VASISRIRELTDRAGAHWESTWQWDRYASERTKLVKDTHAVMLDRLADRTTVSSTSSLEAERNYFEKFSRVITPKKKSLDIDIDREIANFEKAVNKRVKDADGILERFFQKSLQVARLHFFIMPEDRPAEERQELRRLEKLAEDLRSESLAILVDGLGKSASDPDKRARYMVNRQRVSSKLDKINGLVAKLKNSEERLRADVDFDKGEFTNFDTPLAKAYYKANTYRNQTVRFFSKLYANPKLEMIRHAVSHPFVATAVGVLALGATGIGIKAVAPTVIAAIPPLMSLMTPRRVGGVVMLAAGSILKRFQKK